VINYLPTSDFAWLSDADVGSLDVTTISYDSEDRYTYWTLISSTPGNCMSFTTATHSHWKHLQSHKADFHHTLAQDLGLNFMQQQN